MRKIFSISVRVMLCLLGLYILTYFAFILILRYPSAQNAVLPYVTRMLSQGLGAKVEAKGIELALFDRLIIKELQIFDDQNNILLSAQKLRLSVFSFPTLSWFNSGDRIQQFRSYEMTLDDAFINIYRRKRDGQYNFDFLDRKTANRKNRTIRIIDIPCINFNNLSLTMVDSTKPLSKLEPQAGLLNTRYMRFEQVNLRAGLHFDQNQTMRFNIESMSGVEMNSFIVLKHFSSDIVSSDTKYDAHNLLFDVFKTKIPSNSVTFEDTKIEIGKTKLDFDLVMADEDVPSLFKLGRRRRHITNFRHSIFDLQTINLFSPYFVPLEGICELEGLVEGNYDYLESKNLKVSYGSGTTFSANLRLDDYTDADRLFMNIKLENLAVNAMDMEQLFGNVELPAYVHRLRAVRGSTQFVGTLNEFNGQADVFTPWGHFKGDVDFRWDTLRKTIFYRGKVETQKLDVDTILKTKFSPNLTVIASIEGQAFNLEELKIKSECQFFESELFGYALRASKANFTIENRNFNGDIWIDDEKGRFQGQLAINFREPLHNYIIKGDFSKVDLKALANSDRPFEVSAYINTAFWGTDFDSLKGASYVRDFRLRDRETTRELHIPVAQLSTHRGDLQYVDFQSSLMDFNIQGDLAFSQAYALFDRIFNEGARFFAYDSSTITRLKAGFMPLNRTQFVEYHFNFENLNPLIEFLDGDVFLNYGATLNGRFRGGSTDDGFLIFKADSLHFGYYAFKDMTIRFDFERPVDTQPQALISAKGEVSAKKFYIHKIDFDQFKFTTDWHAHSVSFDAACIQQNLNNFYRLAGVTSFFKEGSSTALLPDSTKLFINGETWTIEPDNYIFISKNIIKSNNFLLKSAHQSVELYADINSEQQMDDFYINFDSLDLKVANPFLRLPAKIDGQVNGAFSFKKLLTKPITFINGKVDDFKYANIRYGDVIINSQWSESQNILGLNLYLTIDKHDKASKWVTFKTFGAESDTLMRLEGYYDPLNTDSPLQFNLISKALPARLATPFLDHLVYDLEGHIFFDSVIVTGKLNQPRLSGIGRLDVTFGLKYFQNKFYINDAVALDAHKVLFSNFKIHNLKKERPEPNLNQYVIVHGYLEHAGFTKLNVNLDFSDFKNLHLFGTKPGDNDYFYGNLFVEKGQATLTGPYNDLKIKARGSTGKGTSLFIPITDFNPSELPDYIVFKGRDLQEYLIKRLNNSTLDVDLIIDLLPSAEVTIILDERAGDKIQGRGTGTLNMTFPKQGEFSMSGQYEFSEGQYNFTFLDFVNKNFIIDRGGRISWNGDPYNALMNIKALYRVPNASLRAWDTTQTHSGTIVDILMDVKGSLKKPEINFSINLPNIVQQQNFAINSILKIVENDQQELNRQVFSLLTYNSVSPIGTFFAQNAPTSGVTSSMSEFLSAQLNALIQSTLSRNVGVSFLYNQQILNMTFKANFFNNRLQVERNGAITSTNQQNVTLGNVSIQWRLLPGEKITDANTGLLAVEIFNRENIITNRVASSNRGVGIFFKKEFDAFWQRQRIKGKYLGSFDTQQ